MRSTGNFEFGLPRFTGAVRTLILLSAGIWVALLLLWATDRPLAQWLMDIGSLYPPHVLHGWIWQFFTYGFVHQSPQAILTTAIGVFFIGSAVQDVTGSRSFFELYIASLVGAGILGFFLSFTGFAQGETQGAGAAVNALLIVFYLFNRSASIYLFPFPFQVPVKWVVIVIAVVEAGYWILTDFSFYFTVNLLGFASGYFWWRFLRRRTSLFSMIDSRIYGIRNSYHRWKRRRAARKFQVYMRKHQDDPKQYFDEYGNFKPPDDKDKPDRGGWVN